MSSQLEPARCGGRGVERYLFAGLMILAFAVGFYLRWQQLSVQWLTDDEWHAVHKILSGASYAEIALSAGVADYSIPQTLIYKWLAGWGGIDELGMRLPMLVAGVMLVAGGGWWAWRNFGPGAAWAFSALLALSPLLINFSRTARPSALTVLLGWIALLALDRWRRRGGNASAFVYALSAVGACWLHMAVAPFVLAPLCWIALCDVRKSWCERSLTPMTDSLLLGLPVAVGVTAFALVPMVLNRAALATRMGADLPTLDTLIGVWYVWLGTDSSSVVVGFLGLAAAGVGTLARRRSSLLVLVGIGVLATIGSIYLTRPAWVHNPLTFARYMLPAQPLLLLCAALGLAACAQRLPGRCAHAGLLVIVPPMVLFGSPTPALLAVPNNFTLHYWYQFDYRPAHNPVRSLLGQFHESPFWRQLGTLPHNSVRVAVAGHGLESFSLLDVRWQPIHGQPVWNALRVGYCGSPPYWGEVGPDSGFRLRNVVYLGSPDTLRDMAIDYVVFNRGTGWRGRTDVTVPDVESCIKRFREEHGDPTYSDEDVVAFRLPKDN
jgi:hypothetical protein